MTFFCHCSLVRPSCSAPRADCSRPHQLRSLYLPPESRPEFSFDLVARESSSSLLSWGGPEYEAWMKTIANEQPRPLFQVGSGEMSSIEVGPELILALGGLPGSGKTSLVMQWTVDVLRNNPSMFAAICNLEMSPHSLMDRQLARLSGVSATDVRKRRFDPEAKQRIKTADRTMQSVMPRVAFIKTACTVDGLCEAASQAEVQLLVLDYLQKLRPPAEHRSNPTASLDYAMGRLRELAMSGVAVIVLSSLGRTANSTNPDPTDLRGSAAIEFESDNIYLMSSVKKSAKSDPQIPVVLSQHKSKYGDCRDVRLIFDRTVQSFTSAT